jgi:DNA-binding GntR family transcriptional regulator
VNAELHATLLELSGHATAMRLIESLNAQTVRYQYRTILIPGRPGASVAEHAAIVEAVTAGNEDEAELAMRRHLLNVAEAVRGGRLPGGIDNASRGVL